MKHTTLDDDRWESLPPPERREEPAHTDSSPDTCVFGAPSARPKETAVGMPASVSLRAHAIVESLRPSLTPPTAPGPFAPVAGMALFEDDSEVSDIGVFRRSAILRGQGGASPQASRRAVSVRPKVTESGSAPTRTQPAMTSTPMGVGLAAVALFALAVALFALRGLVDAVVGIVLAAR